MRLVNEWAKVRVPATSANLGSGFDSMGVAFALYDEIEVQATVGPTEVEITGEGSGGLPKGEDHLVVKAVRLGLDAVGAPQVGLRMKCHNRIPHGRGLGSSAAAVVAGLLIAKALISDPEVLSKEAILQLATSVEKHPDNAAPAIYGGATIAWVEQGKAQAIRLDLHKDICFTVMIPTEKLPTTKARAVLPKHVPFQDATFNLSRAALLAVAMQSHPELLFTATQDRLHQNYRAEAMPASLGLVDYLRQRGIPAVVSGAGPTVAAFGTIPESIGTELEQLGWQVLHPEIDLQGAMLLK